MRSFNAGILGCGVISRTYAGDIGRFFPQLRIVACADLETALAEKLAGEFGIPKACSTAELMADPEIELVINLTPPQAHVELNRQILEAVLHHGEHDHLRGGDLAPEPAVLLCQGKRPAV